MRWGRVSCPPSTTYYLLPCYLLLTTGFTPHQVGLPASGRAGSAGQPRRFAQAIMPNSRLIVLPSPYNQSDAWDMQLLLAPRQQAVVGLVLAGCLLALGLIILTLEIRERVQDAAEKKLVVGAHVIGVQDPTVRVVRRTS